MYVLFVDLAGFTAYSEQHGERAAARLAASFALRAMQVGRRSGLRPIKTVGDAVIFTSPDAERAGTGALVLAREFDGHPHPLRVHIGVAAGEVIESDGDVFGFPVNLAAHLAADARPGQILVDQKVAGALSSRSFRVVSAGRKRMKGLSRALDLFRLSGARLGEVAK